MSDENPFDKLGVDPTTDAQKLTEVLRRRAQRLPPEERREIQEMWRELTLHDDRRVRWAFLAHPRDPDTEAESVEELRSRVPPLVDRHEPPELVASVSDTLLDLGDCNTLSERLSPPTGFCQMAEEATTDDPTKDSPTGDTPDPHSPS